MAHVLGMNCKLYVDEDGVGVGTWVLAENVKDVTLTLETAEADVTTRANDGWRATVATLKEATIECEMQWDTADTIFTAIQTAFLTNATIGVAAMDGLITTPGSQGLVADMAVVSFSRSEPLEEAATVSVTLKPTYSTTAPTWTTIGSS